MNLFILFKLRVEESKCTFLNNISHYFFLFSGIWTIIYFLLSDIYQISANNTQMTCSGYQALSPGSVVTITNPQYPGTTSGYAFCDYNASGNTTRLLLKCTDVDLIISVRIKYNFY